MFLSPIIVTNFKDHKICTFRRKNPDLWHKLENCLICCWCCCYVPKTVVDEARFAKDVADTAQETVQNNRGDNQGSSDDWDSGRSSIVTKQPH